jgi:hypothetical protein
VIEFVGEDDLDNIGEGEIWTTVETRGRSVRLLKEKIAKLVGYEDFTMCVSAGRHGQFTPLLMDANFEGEDTLLWEVVRVPPSGDMPGLPIATQVSFSDPSPLSSCDSCFFVLCLDADFVGN